MNSGGLFAIILNLFSILEWKSCWHSAMTCPKAQTKVSLNTYGNKYKYKLAYYECFKPLLFDYIFINYLYV